jgi:hypothetical protein
VAPFQSHSEKELIRLLRELVEDPDIRCQVNPLEALEPEFTSAVDKTSKVHALVHRIRMHLESLETSLTEQQGQISKESLQG